MVLAERTRAIELVGPRRHHGGFGVATINATRTRSMLVEFVDNALYLKGNRPQPRHPRHELTKA